MQVVVSSMISQPCLAVEGRTQRLDSRSEKRKEGKQKEETRESRLERKQNSPSRCLDYQFFISKQFSSIFKIQFYSMMKRVPER